MSYYEEPGKGTASTPRQPVVLDDMHKSEYAPYSAERCFSAGFSVCPPRTITLDTMGRYAAFAFRPPAQ